MATLWRNFVNNHTNIMYIRTTLGLLRARVSCGNSHNAFVVQIRLHVKNTHYSRKYGTFQWVHHIIAQMLSQIKDKGLPWGIQVKTATVGSATNKTATRRNGDNPNGDNYGHIVERVFFSPTMLRSRAFYIEMYWKKVVSKKIVQCQKAQYI